MEEKTALPSAPMLGRCHGGEGERSMALTFTQEVAAALAAFPGVADAEVMQHSSESAGDCLVAYVSPAADGLDMAALHARARRLLPGSMVPAAIMVLDASAGGRAPDEAVFPAPDLDGLKPYRAPETTTQEALCNIFAEVLRVPRVGIDDDFFDLGGQSVDAIILASKISDEFSLGISMADLFNAPTVVELDLRLNTAAEAVKLSSSR
jgi:acyl carrier protein